MKAPSRRRWWWSATAIALGVIVAAGASAGRGWNLHLHRTVSVLSHDLLRTLAREPYVVEDRDPPIVCWGDSLTEGFRDTFGHDWPSLLTYNYHRPTVNEGAVQETSAEIRRRMLARTRPAGPERVVIWAGRNDVDNADGVMGNIGAMVASLNPGSLFLILGVLNSQEEASGSATHGSVTALNKRLRDTYGDRFVPIREVLLARASSRFAGDIADRDRGVVPGSLRADDLHLNDIGQAIVAATVDDAMRAQGW